jgi:uncharacterized integral membrane protein
MVASSLTDVMNYVQIGRTALVLAAEKGHLDVVDALVKAGADKNSKDEVCCYLSMGKCASCRVLTCHAYHTPCPATHPTVLLNETVGSTQICAFISG